MSLINPDHSPLPVATAKRSPWRRVLSGAILYALVIAWAWCLMDGPLPDDRAILLPPKVETDAAASLSGLLRPLSKDASDVLMRRQRGQSIDELVAQWRPIIPELEALRPTRAQLDTATWPAALRPDTGQTQPRRAEALYPLVLLIEYSSMMAELEPERALEHYRRGLELADDLLTLGRFSDATHPGENRSLHERLALRLKGTELSPTQAAEWEAFLLRYRPDPEKLIRVWRWEYMAFKEEALGLTHPASHLRRLVEDRAPPGSYVPTSVRTMLSLGYRPHDTILAAMKKVQDSAKALRRLDEITFDDFGEMSDIEDSISHQSWRRLYRSSNVVGNFHLSLSRVAFSSDGQHFISQHQAIEKALSEVRQKKAATSQTTP